MNDDRALVIGIRRYRDGTERWLPDLQGPDNDAAAIAEWLRRADGGGLQHDNVRVVRSADLPDPFPSPDAIGPAQAAIHQELRELSVLPPSPECGGQWAGRRFYLYVSGHGLANEADQPGLVTADAERKNPVNVLVKTWVQWFYTAAQFKELVLWVDCCATRFPTMLLYPCDLPDRVGQNLDEISRFFAFAAPFNKDTVEAEMSDGEWHGVFTYALLTALKGAVAGDVSTSSIRDYLNTNMQSFMREDQRIARIAKRPSFLMTDELSFPTPDPKPRYAVTLTFDGSCVGKRATIAVNRSSPTVAETDLAGTDWNLDLEAGLYAVFVPEIGLEYPFSISGSRSHERVTVS